MCECGGGGRRHFNRSAALTRTRSTAVWSTNDSIDPAVCAVERRVVDHGLIGDFENTSCFWNRRRLLAS